MKTEINSYEIKASGSGKIAATLAKLCAEGEIGETLVRNGCTQSSFSLFIAKLAEAQLKKGKTAEQLAVIFDMVSACNASAASKALATCEIFAEEISIKDKVGNLQPVLLETYWSSLGGGKAAPNLSLLD